MYTIQVQMRQAGSRRSTVITPISYELPRKPNTVQELLTLLGKTGAEAYNAREDKGQILSCLTKQQIEAKAETGKISFGLRNGKAADPDKAAETALQCFEDGIFRVFANQTELTRLDQEIPWDPEPVFTLIRLTMLAGW